MGIAVRAVVSLFHLANRAKELDGQILAFSLSYNDLNVRIYGYYPKVEGNEVAYYRHPIAYITMQDSNSSKERWKTYRFVRSIYEHWAPAHLKRLRSLLDEIGTVMPAPAEKTGLSQFFASSSIYSDATSVEGLQTKPTTPIELPAPAIPNIFPSSQHGVGIKNTSVKRRASLKLRKR